MTELGVNIDHVATVRQARRTFEPDPVGAAFAADRGGADGITIHLREDRRHIQDRDLELLRKVVFTKLNLEMATSEEIIRIALRTVPDQITLVPEKRQEVTTEGGLDVKSQVKKLAKVVSRLQKKGIVVSLFIDPESEQIEASRDAGADAIELHTGEYANAPRAKRQMAELNRLVRGADKARDIGLIVNAGHGLTYKNVGPIIRELRAAELNIGHSIIARAIFVGLEEAVRQMKELIVQYST
ncbi:MAG: pyridoxine 5'-phosphate synthase [Planctomycetes bacterium]|nr:pyridoxine 5'-phosphate synthase [Planctomycetota bacterium]